MNAAPAAFPPAGDGLGLHVRLCELDATAPADVCRAYFDPLLHFLERAYPGVDPHARLSAVDDVLFKYFQRPQAYDPARGELATYLRLAAWRRLQTLLRREKRHVRGKIPWSAVEDDPVGAHIPGEEEPSVALERAEEERAYHALLQSLTETFTAEERRVLDLILAGERRTAVFAEALGLSDSPPDEQERQVKRVKDRIKKRLERGRDTHG